ncbi:hypothetical protein PPTG_03184 [Phytophthora nicotianae INRA-310]|uniref:Uncharacterized protein n=2 Tax=Phytophthora nicotianae TaxID=4792 RepID=W2R3Z8_PHYN3|nr:hypothetical protein PPTG_03184 [Phytophthora nicotianae INRA-310]ETN20108.1 hypothetical protein PPTG_03184 [Phytophthora nicotianae INRA-310]
MISRACRKVIDHQATADNPRGELEELEAKEEVKTQPHQTTLRTSINRESTSRHGGNHVASSVIPKDLPPRPEGGDVEQLCLITEASSAASAMNTIKDEISRLEGAVLKPDREEQFEAQSWEALRKSGNPVPHTAREYANVFPNKIPAELPANCGVNHEINLVPEAN